MDLLKKIDTFLNEERIDYDLLKSQVKDFDDFIRWFKSEQRVDYKKYENLILKLVKIKKTEDQIHFICKNVKRATLEKWIPIYLGEKGLSQTVIRLDGKYGYFEDNAPWNLEWREKQKSIAVSAGDKFIYRNSVTAGFSKPLRINPEYLNFIQGLNGEHYKIKPWDESVRELAKDMEIHGYKGSPVSLSIDSFGEAWVYEGNHRIRAARLAGIKYIPVEIKYYGCGELEKGKWSPVNILKLAK